jgi:hypothetical protein
VATRRFREKGSRGTAVTGSFVPFKQPTAPPPNYYDPALDAQGRASGRGLQQLLDDLKTAGDRAGTQLGLDQGALATSKARELSDFTTRSTQAGQDHTTNLASILRNYTRLGTQQASAGTAAGMTGGGGFFAAAKAARDANQGLDTSAENTAYGRLVNSLNDTHKRFGEDASTQADAIQRGYDYGVQDRGTQGGRARIENQFFQGDINDQRVYQGTQNGYIAPTKPSNEFTSPGGQPYRLSVETGGVVVARDPSGKELWRRHRGGGPVVVNQHAQPSGLSPIAR